MIDNPSYTPKGSLASENRHSPKDVTWLTGEIARSFPGAERIGEGKWTALCPLCGGKVMVLVNPATGTAGVNCLKECPRDAVLEAAGIDPKFPGLYRPEEEQQIRTPDDLLRGIGDTPDNRLSTLQGYFSSDPNDPEFENPEFKRFLKDSCDKDPVFVSKLTRLMSASMWPAKAREAYLIALGIADPQSKGSPADETSAPAIVWQTARDLQNEELPPLRWCVPGLIPEGAAILAGRPTKRAKVCSP